MSLQARPKVTVKILTNSFPKADRWQQHKLAYALSVTMNGSHWRNRRRTEGRRARMEGGACFTCWLAYGSGRGNIEHKKRGFRLPQSIKLTPLPFTKQRPLRLLRPPRPQWPTNRKVLQQQTLARCILLSVCFQALWGIFGQVKIFDAICKLKNIDTTWWL